MQKEIVDLQKNEVEEIEKYFERMNSIKALILAFESDEMFSENSCMYEKLIQDMTDTNKNLSNWWRKIIKKYSLEKYKPEQLFVDFYLEQIKLAE